MNCLITYYTRTGNTEKVAEKIAEKFDAEREKIIDKKKRTGIIGWIRAGYDAIKGNLTEIEPIKKDPDDYDLILLGTPVWAGRSTPAIKTYIANNKDKFENIAIFTSSGGDGFQDALEEVKKAAGQEPIAMDGFLEKNIEKGIIDPQIDEFTRKIRDKIPQKKES
jgi:flavodoxin